MHTRKNLLGHVQRPTPMKSRSMVFRQVPTSIDGQDAKELTTEDFRDVRDFMVASDFSISSLLKTGNPDYFQEVGSLSPGSLEMADHLFSGVLRLQEMATNLSSKLLQQQQQNIADNG